MAKDNITYPSLITLSKSFESDITKELIDNSIVSNELTFSSAIGIEDVVPLYVAEYQTVYDAFTIKPSDILATAQNAMVEGLVNTGVWAKKDVFYVFAAHTNDNGEALINWINPGTHDATLVNNPAFVAFEGFTGDGATSHLMTDFIPSIDLTRASLNSFSFGGYLREALTNALKSLAGALSTTSMNFFTQLLPLHISTFNITSNTDSASRFSYTETTPGMIIADRTASNNTDGYVNKIKKGSDIDASTGIPIVEFYILARNIDGIASSFMDNQLSMFFIAESLGQTGVDNLTDYFEAYMDSNGRGVIP